MSSPFRPYEGEQPYIFVSYAHADAPAVMEIIGDMHARGYRIWYDEGIEAGSEWPEYIASHLYGAALVLAFLSPAYLASDNCRKEMHYALTKKKKAVNIFLEETRLSPGMEMQIGNLFALMKYTYPSEAYFYEKLYGAELLRAGELLCTGELAPPAADAAAPLPARPEKRAHGRKMKRGKPAKPARPRKKHGKLIAGIVALGVFGCAVAAGIVGYFTGYLERLTADIVQVQTLDGATAAEFRNPLLEQAARAYAGIPEGPVTVDDLRGLTALYVCGDRYWFAEPQRGVPETTAGADAAEVVSPDGETVAVQRGSIRDLADLAYFPSLTVVWLQFQNVTELTTLPACAIETLNLGENRVTALAGIENLPKLQTLRADGNAVADLTGLERCLDLRCVSLKGANASDLSVFRPLTRLRELTISNSTRQELFTPLHQSSLTKVTLYDCDLRGKFFRSFDRERSVTELRLVRCQLDNSTGLNNFTGLTLLELCGCTGELDWAPLAELTALKTIRADGTMYDAVAASGTAAEVIKIQ